MSLSEAEKTILLQNQTFIVEGAAEVTTLQTQFDAMVYPDWPTAYNNVNVGDFYLQADAPTQLKTMRLVPPLDESFAIVVDTEAVVPGEKTIELPAADLWTNGVIAWGDGTYTTALNGAGQPNPTHTYATAGLWAITIFNSTNEFTMNFSSVTDAKNKLVEVKAWQDFRLEQNTFKDCSSLFFNNVLLTKPTLSTNISSCFENCSSLTDEDLSSWDFSSVTNATNLFKGCTNFQGVGLDGWDTSSLQNAFGMFRNCSSFDGSTLYSWDTSNVLLLTYFAAGCGQFNPDFSSFFNWDTSSVTNMDSIFEDCVNLQGNGLASAFANVSALTSAQDFATNCTSFTNANYDLLLSAWAALSPSLQNGVLFDMNSTTQYLEIAARAVLTDTHSWVITDGGIAVIPTIFEITTSSAETIYLPSANWSNVNIDWGDGAKTLNYSGSGTTPSHAYSSANTFTVTLTGDFYSAANLRYNAGPSSDKLTSIIQWGETASFGSSAFSNCSNLASISSTDTPTFYNASSGNSFFDNCSSLLHADFSPWATIFSSQGVTDLSYFFNNCSSLATTTFGNWDLSSSLYFEGMFSGCSSLNPAPSAFSGWVFPSASTVDYLFSDCSSLTSLPSFDYSLFERLSFMFSTCTSLTLGAGSLNIDLSNALRTQNMFEYCSNLTCSSISLDCSSATLLDNMFLGCSSLAPSSVTIDLSSCQSLNYFFSGCSLFNPSSLLLTLNTSSTFTATAMFQNCSAFVGTDLDSLNVSKCTDLTDFCSNTAVTTSNYDLLLAAWAALSLQTGVSFDMGSATYTDVANRKIVLSATKSATNTTNTTAIHAYLMESLSGGTDLIDLVGSVNLTPRTLTPALDASTPSPSIWPSPTYSVYYNNPVGGATNYQHQNLSKACAEGLTGNFGFEFWMYTSGHDGYDQPMVCGAYGARGFDIFFLSNQIRLATRPGGTTSVYDYTAFFNKWTHVAYVFAGTSLVDLNIKVYLDGVLRHTTSSGINYVAPIAGDDMMIGAYNGGQGMDMKISLLRFFTFSAGTFNPAVDLLYYNGTSPQFWTISDGGFDYTANTANTTTEHMYVMDALVLGDVEDVVGGLTAANTGSPALYNTTLPPITANTVDFPNTHAATASHYFQTPSAIFDGLTGNFGFEAWVRVDNFGSSGSFAWIMCTGTTNVEGYGLGLYDSSGDKIVWIVSRAGANTQILVDFSADSNVKPDNWFHVCGIYEAGSIKFFINGVQRGTTTVVPGYVVAGTTYTTTVFAAHGGATRSNAFDGKISQLRFFTITNPGSFDPAVDLLFI